MSSAVLENSIIGKGIVFLEDSPRERKIVANALNDYLREVALEAPFLFAENEDEAVDLCKKGFRNFIVDIHMGSDRQQEGLNLLQRLKKINPDTFVAILSGHLGAQTKRMAKDADLIQEKTDNRKNDVNTILSKRFKIRFEKLLEQKKQLLLDKTEELLREAKKIDRVLSQSQNIDIPQMLETIDEIEVEIEENQLLRDPICLSDPNFIAFQAKMNDSNWFEKYFNCYVAFVDGELVGSSLNELKLLSDVRSKFPKKPRMIMKVERGLEEVIELPRYLALEDII